jgi:hypothetical protein
MNGLRYGLAESQRLPISFQLVLYGFRSVLTNTLHAIRTMSILLSFDPCNEINFNWRSKTIASPHSLWCDGAIYVTGVELNISLAGRRNEQLRTRPP